MTAPQRPDLENILAALEEVRFYLQESHEELMRDGYGSMADHRKAEPNCPYCRALNRAKRVVIKTKVGEFDALDLRFRLD